MRKAESKCLWGSCW